MGTAFRISPRCRCQRRSRIPIRQRSSAMPVVPAGAPSNAAVLAGRCPAPTAHRIDTGALRPPSAMPNTPRGGAGIPPCPAGKAAKRSKHRNRCRVDRRAAWAVPGHATRSLPAARRGQAPAAGQDGAPVLAIQCVVSASARFSGFQSTCGRQIRPPDAKVASLRMTQVLPVPLLVPSQSRRVAIRQPVEPGTRKVFQPIIALETGV